MGSRENFYKSYSNILQLLKFAGSVLQTDVLAKRPSARRSQGGVILSEAVVMGLFLKATVGAVLPLSVGCFLISTLIL